jgi:2',3'-cyclic-nucleotide 2'-phosphodiesterase (5'-nucleotidase family)
MVSKLQVPGAAYFVAAVLAALSLAVQGCSGDRDEGEQVKRAANLTVVFSSDLLGKIRSCGCAVEDMGGLGRKATYIERVRESVDNLVVVDAGDAFSLDLSYSQTEAELTFDAFELMGVDVFTPGEIEFIFGLPFLQELAGRVTFSVLAANIVDASTGEPAFGSEYAIIELEGGLTLGITGVLDDTVRFPGYIDRSTFDVLPVEESLQRVMPALREKADFLILLSHLGLERSRALVELIPDFDLCVVGHGRPVIKRADKVGKTLLLATGGEGQYVGRLDLSLTGSGAYEFGRMQIVPLKEEIAVHEGVKAIFEHYGVELTEKDIKKK